MEARLPAAVCGPARSRSRSLVLSLCSLVLAAVVVGCSARQQEEQQQQPYSACQQQFLSALVQVGRNASAPMVEMIDRDTPVEHCVKKLCIGDYAMCDPVAKEPDQIPYSDLVLVFSDEFNVAGRDMSVLANDSRWTAENIYYFPTQDIEVYKPEQVTTKNGSMHLTIERLRKPEKAVALQPDGSTWNVPKNFKSGMVNTWNKFCFTGGYMEMSVQLPGTDKVPGFWPAFWAMGNLGRAGYMPSTGGFWPYSYNVCGKGSNSSTAMPDSKVPDQTVDACPSDPESENFINRTLYGFEEGKARNAPEFDVFEIVTVRGLGSEASQTLQMAPLIPEGTTWADLMQYQEMGIADGVAYPGGISFMRTEGNQWSGRFGRPGNEYQDSLSAISHLNETFYTSHHTFGVDWDPGNYLRWYVDGLFAYEINSNALREMEAVVDGKTVTIGERMIPVEPMYMIMNLGMSRDFGEVDVENLPFPADMDIEWVRVYQRPNKVNVGCNPPDYPTEQWIACHKDKYMWNKDDEILLKGATCASGGVARVARWAGGVMVGVAAVLSSFFP